MNDIPKLEPITTEIFPVGGLTDFQEELLCAAADWKEACLYADDSASMDAAWLKFRKLLAQATKEV